MTRSSRHGCTSPGLSKHETIKKRNRALGHSRQESKTRTVHWRTKDHQGTQGKGPVSLDPIEGWWEIELDPLKGHRRALRVQQRPWGPSPATAMPADPVHQEFPALYPSLTMTAPNYSWPLSVPAPALTTAWAGRQNDRLSLLLLHQHRLQTAPPPQRAQLTIPRLTW